MLKLRWVITEADPSGNCAAVYATESPYMALSELDRLRFVADQTGKGNRSYGVHDATNEEAGDVQSWLEEICFNDPDEGRRYDAETSYRLLTSASTAALDEILERGVFIGRAIESGNYRNAEMPSIFDAVNAYYVARRARERADKERHL